MAPTEESIRQQCAQLIWHIRDLRDAAAAAGHDQVRVMANVLEERVKAME